MDLIVLIGQRAVIGFGIAFLLLYTSDLKEGHSYSGNRKIGVLAVTLIYTVFSCIAGAIMQPILVSIIVLTVLSALDKYINKNENIDAITNALVNYTLNTLGVLFSSIIVYIIFYVFGISEKYKVMTNVALLTNIIVIIIVGTLIRKFHINLLLKDKYTKIGIDILCIGCHFANNGFLKIKKLDLNLILGLLLFILIMCTLMAFVWLKDKKEQMKREEEMQKSNSDLSGIVHKSRELIPALASKLKYLEDHAGESEEIAEELQNFRAEIEILSGEQAEEDRRNNMFMKTYEGSGFTVLDGMFQNRLAEAAKEDIDFDIIIRHPLNRLVREQNITQLALQRMIGDLISNAFRAVKKSERDDKSILFCAGYLTEDVYEIEIHDNADLFPIEILKHFGERGYTTGGTGNGIADILDTVDLAGASFCLEEYPPDSSLFTKRIAVCFDRAHRMKIITERKEELGEMERFVVM